MKIGLVDILKVAGFDPTRPTKLVRHPDSLGLRQQDWFELYQRYQRRPVFHGIKQLVSFRGLSGTRAGFDGVYLVNGYRASSEGLLLDCPQAEQWKRNSRFFYDLERDPRFDDLQNRLVIDWGPAVRTWAQKVTNKAVLEILAPGRALEPFVDYLEFSLTHDQLKTLFAQEDAHRDWRSALSAVAGVYLILAQTSGDQYVGSAYGEGGIWGRWRTYAATGDGGNIKLRALIERNSDYPKRFRFSVLQILPKTMALGEVLQREVLYKHKLGTRATGLNSN